ncbi:hypothetical protein IGS68_16650 [Skermanella sp. TT6]|uniref:Polysaccharide chain length determinant N-terminal domain-containing protein n=1 Tax=Skermanella cutis TaxID=2775420 RepID=A0ABX7B054_9PROT|nr:hypothetical protein [Skermanella sp. TT6]QQP87715.1 hypothetical protein IGS68_16650 [Skermanella sp. TT6]
MSLDTDLIGPLGEVQRLLRNGVTIALAGRRLVLGVTALSVVFAVLALRQIEPVFTATLVVGPTAAGGLLGRAAPLPAIPPGSETATIPGAGETMSNYERFLYELTSFPVAEELAAAPEVMHRAFERMWDADAGTWVPDDSPVARLRRFFNELVGRIPWTEPDGRTLVRYLQKEVRIQQVGTTPLRRISYRHADPEFARLLLNRLYATTERQLRSMAVRDNGRMIGEISRKIAVTQEVGHVGALRSLLIAHERFAMMMDVDLPLAANLVQPAMAEAVPDTPDPVVVVAIAAAAGFVAGLCLVFIRSADLSGFLKAAER